MAETETKKEILAFGQAWQRHLNLGYWTIKHLFNETECAEDEETIATTNAMWQYHKAQINWYLPKAQSLTKPELEEVVVHEMLHVVVSPAMDNLPNRYGKFEELVVQNLAKIAIGLRDGS